MTQTDSRLRFLEAQVSRRPEQFAGVVAEGLSAPQKWLPCRYFYDEAGSELFERICELPEYYLTRTERSILERCAGEVVQAAGPIAGMVEFGSGSSDKTRLLLDAGMACCERLEYVPIDISGEFLYHSSRRLLDLYPSLRICAIASSYDDAIQLLPKPRGGQLFLFLGSNIGNFDDGEACRFLTAVRGKMHAADSLLVGVDLNKPAELVEPAYNDAAGITAMFNKNMLKRINRELHADFELDEFEHSAPFIASRSRIEMRLVSRRNQCVGIGALGRRFEFARGEFIHTENSYKYEMSHFERFARAAGLAITERWQDERGWFALCLLRSI